MEHAWISCATGTPSQSNLYVQSVRVGMHSMQTGCASPPLLKYALLASISVKLRRAVSLFLCQIVHITLIIDVSGVMMATSW